VGFASGAEDAWILSQFPKDFVGYAIEVGAYDGMQGSNTLSLEHAGWTTVAIEPNPECEDGLKTWRQNYRLCACSDFDGEADFHLYVPGAAGYSSLRPTMDHPVWHPEPGAPWSTIKVAVRRLDSLLAELDWPGLDALSIDTEGTEMDVLRGIDLARWKPQVIIIECWDDPGPHLDYLAKYGYKRDARNNVNDLMVRCESSG
jgi:FkbM family methyltransferase